MNKARVIEEHKTNYIISDNDCEYTATVRGSFFEADSFPKVGDFVIYNEVADGKAVIEEILPRTTTISRKAVGAGGEQVIVANVDVMFIVMGLDGDFNLSRLERYLLLARQSGVKPVIILNKCDSVDEPESFIERTRENAGEVPIQAVSAITGENMETLLEHLDTSTVAVLLGSSGAGKSTITNWLLCEDRQQVQDVRTDDSHGRHTTTSRQLFTLPNGGFLIDTPGIRELGVQSTEVDEEVVFAKLEELSEQCRFPNCDHEKSKGCAILEAVKAGEIEERQFKNYQKLQRERLFEESKHDEEVSRNYKHKQKNLHKGYHEIQKRNRFRKSFY
jgi:ribosome biogenesis GTPase